jgi:hypothetical protein
MANVNENAQSAKSQCDMIAAWLERGFSITSLEALRLFGCLRLSSRIWDLKERCLNIQKKTIVLPNKKRVCEYFIPK